MVLLLLVSLCWAGRVGVRGCLGLLLKISALMFCSVVLPDEGVLPGCLLPGLAGGGPGLCALWVLRGFCAEVS